MKIASFSRDPVTKRASVVRTLVLSGVLVCSLGGNLQQQAQAQVNVLTYHNDNARTGQNLQETLLNPFNVNANTFGKLFSQAVEGYVYAQPLYMSNVAIPNKGTHNVVFVATEHNYVYAFDADSNTGDNANWLWRTNLTPNGGTTVLAADVGTNDIVPEIGVTGTPVIDGTTGTLYVVAKTKEGSNYHQRLHALDVTTGAEKSGSPVEIAAMTFGRGDGTNGTTISLNPLRHNQRPALLLANGIVYITWASHGDNDPYHGWVVSYNAKTLGQLGVFNATPNGKRGGIWQAGAGPAADAEGIYLATGNGTYGQTQIGGSNYGDSILKLKPNLNLLDFFAPFNEAALNAADTDLGSGGVMLLPTYEGDHPRMLIQAGKEGKIYLVNRDTGQMGSHNGTSDKVVQSIAGQIGGIWGMPAFYSNRVYFGGVGDFLKAFDLAGTTTVNVDHSQGFANSSDLQINGSAKVAGTHMRLTDGGGSEAGSAFTKGRVNVSQFTTTFQFQILNSSVPSADGMTFCLQATGPKALGPGGGGLGFGPDTAGGTAGIKNSVAIKFDLYSNQGEGVNSTGLYKNGVAPTTAGSINLTGTGIDLHSQHVFEVKMTYDGTTLKVTITDTQTSASATQTYTVDIPGTLGGKAGFVGFTGGTGGLTATQDVISWTYTAPIITVDFLLSNTPTSQSTMSFGYPGTTVSISDNSLAASPFNKAIVWALEGAGSGDAVLHAFNANDLSQELYNTTQAAASRDALGSYVKFTVPTVANGKVYVATQGQVNVLGVSAVAVSGVVTLQDCKNSVQPITLEFRPVGGGSKFSMPVTLGADGSFSVSGIPAQAYKLAIKGSKWLRRVVMVDASTGGVSGVTATLLAGDANDDNYAGLDDLGLLADAFDTKPGDDLWNPAADFNCDGKVDLDDLGLLALNFDVAGDP